MEVTADHHFKQNKPDSERQLLHAFPHMQNLDLKTNDVNIKRGLLGEDQKDREERAERVMVG
jgi:hypothetical protein